MPVSLVPILLLAGVGLAATARKKSKLKRPTVGTSGKFAVEIMFPDAKQAEFAYGLMREIPGGPMQAGSVTMDVKEQYYAVGSVEVLGHFTSTERMSESFAFVRISERIKEVLHRVSDDSCFTVELYDVKAVSTMSDWDWELVRSCSRVLADLRQDEERFSGIVKEYIYKLGGIAQKGYIIDYDLIERSVELLNREIPGCQFHSSAETDLKGLSVFGLIAGDGRGYVSEDAFKTWSLMLRYGVKFLKDMDIPIGFKAVKPSMIPDFVKLKMDQFKFRPTSKLA